MWCASLHKNNGDNLWCRESLTHHNNKPCCGATLICSYHIVECSLSDGLAVIMFACSRGVNDEIWFDYGG